MVMLTVGLVIVTVRVRVRLALLHFGLVRIRVRCIAKLCVRFRARVRLVQMGPPDTSRGTDWRLRPARGMGTG